MWDLAGPDKRGLAWLKAHHPEWILYKCDRKTPQMWDQVDPLIDVSQPEVVRAFPVPSWSRVATAAASAAAAQAAAAAAAAAAALPKDRFAVGRVVAPACRRLGRGWVCLARGSRGHCVV